MDISFQSFLKGLSSGSIRIGLVIGVACIVIVVLRILFAVVKHQFRPADKVGIERAKRRATIVRIVENGARIFILLAALFIALRQVGIEIGPLLAGAGIIGLAVSFGAQSLVKDIINGFFILLENNMNVGDVVQIAGLSGTVEKINMRVTVLRDLDGKVHAVPNGDITTITNMTKEWSRAVLDIAVSYGENIDSCFDVLRAIGEDLLHDPVFGPLVIDPVEILGVDSLGDSSVSIKVLCKTQPSKQWQVAREFRRRVLKAFNEKGIEIPYPHRVISFGGGEQESAQKFHLGS
jgi:moderate conductance mechanosensitive channel